MECLARRIDRTGAQRAGKAALLAACLCLPITESASAGGAEAYFRTPNQRTELYTLHMRYKGQGFAEQPSALPMNRSDRAKHYDALISEMARRMGLDAGLIKAVIHAESAFDPGAVSHKGASGLMQLMPQTAKRYGVRRIFDPEQNVRGGSRYLRDLLQRYRGNMQLALAAYNAGENAVLQHQGIPDYPETQTYVRRVIQLYEQYKNQIGSQSRYFRYPER